MERFWFHLKLEAKLRECFRTRPARGVGREESGGGNSFHVPVRL